MHTSVHAYIHTCIYAYIHTNTLACRHRKREREWRARAHTHTHIPTYLLIFLVSSRIFEADPDSLAHACFLSNKRKAAVFKETKSRFLTLTKKDRKEHVSFHMYSQVCAHDYVKRVLTRDIANQKKIIKETFSLDQKQQKRAHAYWLSALFSFSRSPSRTRVHSVFLE